MSTTRLNRELEMTCRIKDKDVALIEKKLSELSNLADASEQLAQSVRKGDWSSTSINAENMPYVALSALQNNTLTNDEFVTLMLYWSARQQFGDKLEILTPENPEFYERLKKNLVINDATKNLTKFSLTLSGIYKLAIASSNSYYLSNENVKDFENVIANLPRAQQVIFCAEELIDRTRPIDVNLKIVDVLSGSSVNFMALTRTQLTGNHSLFALMYAMEKVNRFHRFIPSLGLMQSYLNVKFGKQAVRINPVLGVSSVKQISQNGLTGSRDMAFEFPGVKLPDYADNFLALHDDFRVHDFYHCFAASAIPDEHRKWMVGLADVIKAYLTKQQKLMRRILRSLPFAHDENIMQLILDQQFKEDTRTLSSISNALIDMEHPNYRQKYCDLISSDETESLATIFIRSLIDALTKPLALNLDLNARKHGFYREYILPAINIRMGVLNAISQYIFSASGQLKDVLQNMDDLIKELQTASDIAENSNPSLAQFNQLRVTLAQELQKSAKHVAANPAIFFKPVGTNGSVSVSVSNEKNQVSNHKI